MGLWWVRSDPCGLFSASFTILLILFAEYVVVAILLLPWYGMSWHVVAYSILSILSMVSHSRAQFTDPGAVPRSAIPTIAPQAPVEVPPGQIAPPAPLGPRVCRKCKTVKPNKAHHCSSCGRCIVRMDHHCPWVNNCVAIFNQKYFILFLFYTAACCLYSGTLLVARFISCTNHLRQCTVGGIHAALAIICFVEALVFGLFVIIMMFDQFSAIFDNTPGIDAMQNRHGIKRGKYESLRDVFGEAFSWRWFFPLDLTPKMRLDFEAEVQREMDMGLIDEQHPPHVTSNHSSPHHSNNHSLGGNDHANGHHTVSQPLLSNDKVL